MRRSTPRAERFQVLLVIMEQIFRALGALGAGT